MRCAILVIDDDEPIRKSLAMLLSVRGYSVATASSGARGIQEFEHSRQPIVIADMHMPGLAGLETISRIKSIAPETRVIAMSGSDSAEGRASADAAYDAGVDAFFNKPFEAEVLLAAVAHCAEIWGSA